MGLGKIGNKNWNIIISFYTDNPNWFKFTAKWYFINSMENDISDQTIEYYFSILSYYY